MNKTSRPDYILSLAVLFLVIFGLVMVSSASSVIAYENFGDNAFYIFRQLGSAVIGLVAWFLFQSVNYHWWKKLSLLIFLICFTSLVLVFIPGIGAEYGTAKSWINVVFLPSIQPSEFMKLGLILYIAALFARKNDIASSFQKGLLPVLIVGGMTTFLILAQPDFGTVLIFMVVVGSMTIAAGGSWWHMLGISGVGMSIFMVLIRQKQYILDRFIAFLSPDSYPLGIGYHIKQSLIAVGSGGFWGQGFGHSRQKFEYLPEAQGDSIFAIASEEFGFIGMFLLVLAFMTIAVRGYRIAQKAPDLYGRLVASGITSWIVLQGGVNMAVNLGIFPTTGVPLPFISYGGSSLLALMCAVGILLNISQYAREDHIYRRRVRRPRLSTA